LGWARPDFCSRPGGPSNYCHLGFPFEWGQLWDNNVHEGLSWFSLLVSVPEAGGQPTTHHSIRSHGVEGVVWQEAGKPQRKGQERAAESYPFHCLSEGSRDDIRSSSTSENFKRSPTRSQQKAPRKTLSVCVWVFVSLVVSLIVLPFVVQPTVKTCIRVSSPLSEKDSSGHLTGLEKNLIVFNRYPPQKKTEKMYPLRTTTFDGKDQTKLASYLQVLESHSKKFE